MNEDTREEYSAPICKMFHFDAESLLMISGGDVADYKGDKSDKPWDDLE